MKPQKVKVQRKPPPASGYFFGFSQITITRNGQTRVVEQSHVERRLVNGEWVDVKRSIK